MSRRLAVLLALLMVLPVAAPAAAGPAAGPAGPPDTGAPFVAATDRAPVDGPDGRAAAPGPERRVTLVTGETVTLHRRGDGYEIAAVNGGPIDLLETGRATYLLPGGVDLGTYDRSLFRVETLLERRGEAIPVLLRTDTSPAALADAGLRDVRVLRSAGVVAAEVAPGGPVAGLVADGRVAGVSLDRRLEGTPTPVGAGGAVARDLAVTGEGVTVAVVDTGIDATHPDLAGRVVDRVDLVEDGADALDPNGHGTHVAGVVAGSGEAAGEHAGLAPGASLLDVRAMDAAGDGRASTVVAGIEYAVEAGADVVLLSVGSSIDGGGAIAESAAWAADRGVVVVAAAGNAGQPRTIGAPGRPPGVITVGATDATGVVAPYSSRGPTLEGGLKPDLVAPGDRVVGPLSAGADREPVEGAGRYTELSGTSAAAPRVAGAAALLLAAEPELTAREVENRLASAARPVPGSGPLAQGGGELDVARALDPAVVAEDAVVDLGLLETNATVARTVTFTNHDDRRHDLALETAVRNADLDRAADGVASLNRTSLSLAPGASGAVRLTVDGNTSSGAHAGVVRYVVDGQPRTVAFGFVRGGTVTVEKRPLTAGGSVEGDELWVFTEEGTHDELLDVEDGTARFVAGGGTYVLWSTGTDEATGTTVFLSERRTFDGPERVVLDEGATVPVGIDASAVAERHGPLATRSLVVSMSTEYAGGLARRSVSRANTERRTVRVSPDPDLAVGTTYLLAAGGGDREDLDVPDVFSVAHGVDGPVGASVLEVAPGDFETATYRYHRTTVDRTYRARDRASLPRVWNSRSTRWFDLGDRDEQRVHRLRGAATYERTLRGDGWTASRRATGADGRRYDVLAHPLLGRLDVGYDGAGNVTVAGAPFADGAGTHLAPDGGWTLTATVDGTVVRRADLRDGTGAVAPVAAPTEGALVVQLAGEHPGGHLSTATLTELRLPAGGRPAPGDILVPDRTPTVTDLRIPAVNATNAVPPGPLRVEVGVDQVGVPVEPRIWVATGGAAEPPWRNATGWERAAVEVTDDGLAATVAAPRGAGTLSIAAAVGDVWGRRTRTMTTDAVHVGQAPNTSTRVLSGRLLAPDGTPAANDSVVLSPLAGGAERFLRTDRDGRFSAELPRSRQYELTYVRGDPWGASPRTGDRRPAWHPLGRVDLAEDVALGDRALPAGRVVDVNVTDDTGDAVEGAAVRVTQRAGGRDLSVVLGTGPDGRATLARANATGVRLAGDVEVTVTPPETERYPPGEHRRNLTASEAGRVAVTLETAPPRAVLSASGTFEPGSVVFLKAHRSVVPAGVVAYRWDLDGDGGPERVTTDPVVRYVPDASTARPTLTVVDRAGRTADSTVAVPLDGG